MTDLRAWLSAGAGRFPAAEKVVETSIAWVFLYPDRVLKLKKPVDFGFLDFRTPDQRRWACEREDQFNRATAPGLYLGTHAIVRSPAGDLSLDGEGERLDTVVEMRRFDDDALLGLHPERVDGALAETLGREIARFHAAAPPTPERSGREGIGYVLGSNAELLRAKAELLDPTAVERLIASSESAFEAVAPLLHERSSQGFVRRCHGDLHLGNIMIEAGRPVLFDCIEFNDNFVRIDVLYDLGFLLMDLDFRGRRPEANRAFNGWLDEAQRGLPGEGLWDGLKALSLFQSVRAAVRAHVTVNQDEAPLARRYIAAAEAHLEAKPAKLVAIGGYSGSGKSTRARALAPEMGGAPGAVVLRTDEIRKRLFGRGPLERLPPEAYAAAVSTQVYDALFDSAGAVLKSGWSVVLDAAFLKPEERARAEAVARAAGAAFEGLWMEAEPEVMRARVGGRTGDASDADVRVLDAQLERGAGEVAWPRG